MTKSAWQHLLRLPRKNFPPAMNIADIQEPPTLHKDPPLRDSRPTSSRGKNSASSSTPEPSSSSSSVSSDDAVAPPMSSAGTSLGASADKVRKEYQALVKQVKDDPVAAIWVKFVGDLLAVQDAIAEYDTGAGTEAHQDTFSNYGEVLEKSFDLLKGYVAAKKDPKAHGENFKDKCKELEAFSTFCSHHEVALRLLKKKGKVLKDPSRVVQLEECLNSPISAITEFSQVLKKYSEEDFFPSSHFDEASAILEDVIDNIQSVRKMFCDWRKTTADPFRQMFFSPAKRSLLFVDPTVDYPTMVFSDFVVVFDVKDDEQGEELHVVLYQFPLSLLEVEEKGKITILRAPALSQTCLLKSPNNRAANTLRRKILDAKEALSHHNSLELTKVKQLPADFPKVNCSVTSNHDLVLGTERGLYAIDLQSPNMPLRKIFNSEQRVSKLSVSENLDMMTYSQQGIGEESLGIKLFSHPLVALNTFPCIQRHIHAAEIELKPKTKLYCCFESENKSRRILVSSENLVQLLHQARDSEIEVINTTVLEDPPSFMKNVNGDVYIGTRLQIMKFVPNPPGIHGIYQIRDNTTPIDCVVLDEWHIFGFAEHGIVFDTKNKETYSTLVWADTATSLSVLGPYLLIFTKNFVEVRHRDCLWQIHQIIATPNATFLHETEHYLIVNGQVVIIQAK